MTTDFLDHYHLPPKKTPAPGINSRGRFAGAFPMYGEMALNGSGIGMWTTTYHSVGEVTMSVIYNVESYGSVAMEYSSLNVLRGGIGTGGEFLIMTGPFDPGAAAPWFQAAVR